MTAVQRSPTENGKMAGTLLADALIDLADGKVPASWPVAAAGRSKPDEAFTLAHFPDGSGAAVRGWLEDPARFDAVVITHPRGGIVTVLLARCEQSDETDVECEFDVTVDAGRVATSAPSIVITEGVPELVANLFFHGILEGISEHARADELCDRIGVLGPFKEG